jgi:hypothetical protein
MSDDELTRVRARIEQAMRTGTFERRMAVFGQLEAIDIERERRISAPSA